MASALKRPEPKPTYSELGFDDDLVTKLKEFNKADFDFYHRMNETFWETVRVSKIFSSFSPNEYFRIYFFLENWRTQNSFNNINHCGICKETSG